MLASCGLPLHTCVLLFYVLLDCCCPCPTAPPACSKKLGYVPERDEELEVIRPSFKVCTLPAT
jgi:hypothetical protein